MFMKICIVIAGLNLSRPAWMIRNWLNCSLLMHLHNFKFFYKKYYYLVLVTTLNKQSREYQAKDGLGNIHKWRHANLIKIDLTPLLSLKKWLFSSHLWVPSLPRVAWRHLWFPRGQLNYQLQPTLSSIPCLSASSNFQILQKLNLVKKII